jgi:hypothetical protein
MPAKKSKIRIEPITIELTVRTNSRGQIVIGYAGDDDRTPFLGEYVVNAICNAIDAE